MNDKIVEFNQNYRTPKNNLLNKKEIRLIALYI